MTHVPTSAAPAAPTLPVGADPAEPPDVLLEGGPSGLPAELRRHRAAPADDVVKVAYCGGYEHFRRDAAGVFRWSGRTRIAE